MITRLLPCCFILLLVAFAGVYEVNGQDNRHESMIRGQVFSLSDTTPLQLINVIDQHSHMGSPSGLDGSFAIPAAEGDSIRFSSIGYQDFYLVIRPNMPKEGIKVFLKTANYELLPVTVTPYGERVFLRKSFMELNRHEQGDTVHISLRTGTSGPSIPSTPGFSIGWDPVGNSIRRQNAVIAKWIRQQELDSLAAIIFNKEFVKEVTGISESDVDDFMKFCNLKTNYILSVSQYDLGLTIKRYYQNYLSGNHDARRQYQDIREY